MTGPYDSILGRRIDRVLSSTITFIPSSFEVASGDPRLGGALVDIDPASGRATSIRRLMINEADLAQLEKKQVARQAVQEAMREPAAQG
jgi:calcineurin-like phosphoesterase